MGPHAGRHRGWPHGRVARPAPGNDSSQEFSMSICRRARTDRRARQPSLRAGPAAARPFCQWHADCIECFGRLPGDARVPGQVPDSTSALRPRAPGTNKKRGEPFDVAAKRTRHGSEEQDLDASGSRLRHPRGDRHPQFLRPLPVHRRHGRLRDNRSDARVSVFFTRHGGLPPAHN